MRAVVRLRRLFARSVDRLLDQNFQAGLVPAFFVRTAHNAIPNNAKQIDDGSVGGGGQTDMGIPG